MADLYILELSRKMTDKTVFVCIFNLDRHARVVFSSHMDVKWKIWLKRKLKAFYFNFLTVDHTKLVITSVLARGISRLFSVG